ncbi:MAG: histidine phosphatase family protein [Lachnospiraceae bacterium]|nr:histidine phosphatase family protein [Lachnospiraceae bacterium]
MIRRCILIRHGITQGNERKAYTGCGSDDELSPEGRKAVMSFAQDISAYIKDDTLFFSSPLKRAAETAGIIIDAACQDKTAVTVDKLREIDFGIFEGKNHAQLDGNKDYQAWIDSGGTAPIPGGESREAFIKRSMEGFKEVLRSAGEHEDIVIVCHGGNIMAIMSSLRGCDYYEHMTDNLDGYFLEIEIDNEKVSLLTFDRIRDRLHT